MAHPFSEQAVLHTWEKKFCQMAVPFLAALGARRLHAGQMGRTTREAELPHTWAIGWRGGHSDHRQKTRITFDGIDYSDGDEDEGKSIIYDLPDERRGWSEVYRPRAIPIDREIEKSIEMHEEQWNEYSASASFEVTNRTTAKAEASVGDVASASVESETTTTAKAEFGMDSGQRKQSVYTHVARDKVRVEVGTAVEYWVDVMKRKVVTPVTENGFIEASLVLDLYDWSEKNAEWLRDSIDVKKNRIGCNTIQDLIWFIEGQRVAEYPNMRNFLSTQRRHNHWSAKGSVAFYEWLKNKENRRVSLAKERVRIYESASEVQNAFVD